MMQPGAPTWPKHPLGLNTCDVDGLPFVATTVSELASLITDSAGKGEGGWVVTPNIDILRRWKTDAAFQSLVADATLFTADGAPIVWASKILGNPLPGRLTGSDLFVELFKKALGNKLRLALIGGNPGTAEAATQSITARYGLDPQMVRTHCPPLGFENNAPEMKKIEEIMSVWHPHIVFVGLGSPKQEKLIASLRSQWDSAWYLGVGVSFSFVAGDVKRAPTWLGNIGLEWVHRVIQEPKRLARRYLVDGIPFALGLFARSFYKRIAKEN